MMKIRQVLGMLMLVALMGLVAVPASAALYETGFETADGFVASGSVAQTGNGWNVHNATGYCTTETAGALNGGMSLNLVHGGDNARCDVSFTAKAIVTAEFKVTAPTAETYIYIRDGSDNQATTIRFNTTTIAVYDGGYRTLNGYSARTASDTYTIKMVANATSGVHTWQIFIDGSTTAASWGTGNDDVFAFRSASTADTLSNFYLNSSSTAAVGTAGTVLFDDLSITPEPATMTLLLLGLPFALRRRR